MKLPEQFVNQMKMILNDSYSDFEESLQMPSPISIRLNPYKIENDFNLNLSTQIPWCQAAYYLQHRPVFTLDPFFHAGHYYVQEPASMFLDFILKSLEIPKNCNVLDLCSAPGGKSTLLVSYFSDEAFIHCHEYDPNRAQILKHNLERWGTRNTFVTQGPIEQLSNLNMRYKIILVDAPCSGEGMFRKEPEALKQWSPQKVKACTVMQQNILNIAHKLCEPEGYIIYSTCTYNYEENENQLEGFVHNSTYKSVQISNPFASESFENNLFVYRFFPHKLASEGLTIGVIQKQSDQKPVSFQSNSFHPKHKNTINLEDWINDPAAYQLIRIRDIYFAIHFKHLEKFEYLNSNTKFIGGSIPIGQIKGNIVYPEHALSMSLNLNSQIQNRDLDLQEALNFLRATYSPTEHHKETKWVIAKYKTAHLGWFKSNPNGLKNYFPKNQRIRNL